MYLKVLEVYGHLIFPYLDKYTDLVALSQTSSEVSETVLASDFWSEDSLDVCMDPLCYHHSCGRRRLSKRLTWSLLQDTSTKSCSFHIDAGDIRQLLRALTKAPHLRSLNIRIRLSPTLPDFIEPLTTSNSVLQLDHLSIFVKDWSLLPFVDMISILGPNLRSLHLEESSPFKLFHYTQQLCPNLYALSVEGVQSSRDLQCFVSRDLRSLRLIETHIDLSSLATASSSRSPPKISSEAPNDITGFGNLPKLIKLEFMDSIEPLEIVPSILALPPQLLELELRIDYKHSHDCIDTIGKSLPELLSLILHLRDSNEDLDDDDINDFVAMQSLYLVQVSAMKSLAQGCPKLQCFEVLDRLSGGLSPEAFSYLVNFKCLEHIYLLYSANFVHALPQLLTGSKTIAEVIFFEDASYFSDPPLDAEENADDNEEEKKEEKDILSRWEIMCRQLERIGEIFSSVTLELRDDSAWLNMT